jgi:hypothetical protein
LIDIGPMPAGDATAAPAPPPRLTERHVLALGLAMSGAFMLAALAVATSIAIRGGTSWAAIHLALAGAATTAIATFMPHFAVTLAGTRPQPASQRLTGLILVAGGAAAVVLGMTALPPGLAVIGSLATLAGLGFTAQQTTAPRRSPLARRHPIVTATYLVALAQLAVGVSLGGLVAAGIGPVLAAWATLRPAHAWLTLFGAVSLTIFGTLVYLAPTILGARIRPGPWLVASTVGLIAGPITASAGFALGVAPVAILGGVLTSVGAIGQIGYVVDCLRRRGPFTSEHDWRRASVWHLVAGPSWFALAAAVVVAELLGGRPVSGWSIGSLAIPLVAGWMLQELVASWTYLVPAVTPGEASRHAAQRRVLAPASRIRPMAWNVGVALAWAGVGQGLPGMAAAGAAVLLPTAALSAVLLGRALATRGT